MAIVLVDLENVGGKNGLVGTEYITLSDEVYVFYSQGYSSIKYKDLLLLLDSGCNLSFIKLKRTGKNALDFYLSIKFGELLAKGKTEFFICSRDKGFEHLVDYTSISYNNVTIVTGKNILDCFEKTYTDEDLVKRFLDNQKSNKTIVIDDLENVIPSIFSQLEILRDN